MAQGAVNDVSGNSVGKTRCIGISGNTKFVGLHVQQDLLRKDSVGLSSCLTPGSNERHRWNRDSHHDLILFDLDRVSNRVATAPSLEEMKRGEDVANDFGDKVFGKISGDLKSKQEFLTADVPPKTYFSKGFTRQGDTLRSELTQQGFFIDMMAKNKKCKKGVHSISKGVIRNSKIFNSPFCPFSTQTTPSMAMRDPEYMLAPDSMAKWLLSCAALVLGVVVVGGMTRLTESGLSMTEWRPIAGTLPPLSAQDWQAEYEKYKNSPEGQILNQHMSLNEFKVIFYWEWAHRNLGRLVGLAFIVPAMIYTTRFTLKRSLKGKLFLMGGLIGFQGALGWYMVKSGLKRQDHPRVSQYRLAAHLSTALLLFSLMLHTALDLIKDRRFVLGKLGDPKALDQSLSHRHIKTMQRGAIGLLSLVALTIVSGAFVAGLDAGLIYNQFPYMGSVIIPPSSELYNDTYKRAEDRNRWRNLFENPVTVQFNHRVLGITTWVATTALYILSRRLTLPRAVSKLAGGTWGVATLQATLGISTLLYGVPIWLAALHQANSVILLAHVVALWSAMRKPSALKSILTRIPSRPIQKGSTKHTQPNILQSDVAAWS